MKKFSHSPVTKVLFFILAACCLSGAIKVFVDVGLLTDGRFDIVLEENYFTSRSFIEKTEPIIKDIAELLAVYKNEENILQGGAITKERLKRATRHLWMSPPHYSPRFSEEENYSRYEGLYPEEIEKVKNELIKKDMKAYHALQERLAAYDGVFYYASDGEQIYSNTYALDRQHLPSYPAYLAVENYRWNFHPEELEDNNHLYRWINQIDRLDLGTATVYLAFTEDFLNTGIEAWENTKARAAKGLWQTAGLLSGFLLCLFYLALTAGRRSCEDREVHFLPIDKIYNDLNLCLVLAAGALWIALIESLSDKMDQVIVPLTVPAVCVVLLLFLALVKHYKNGTLLKHTLLYRSITAIYTAVSKVYASGSVGIKTMILVIGYPILVVLSFYLFPVTIGLAAWLAYQQVKVYNTIKEGVAKIKNGDIQHVIPVTGNGELAKLAADINSITEGLKKAVENELRSERLKTELITNVSHDIRTPLTSIITYVDLLKKESDPVKAQEYINILDQKAKRLQTLVDDLFEAAKASSGNMPVYIEKIDLVALISQGLGEVSEKIEAAKLDFRFRHPQDKVYVAADGKLLWRSIENLLSNIFKYALKGSRVYIDLEDRGREVLLTFKNISAQELNISAAELMERFKRGDEARTTEGSGLGLSVAQSLIDLQHGKFNIEIDGDLFKAMITLPKYQA